MSVYTILALNFDPCDGGISHFTNSIAKQLYKSKKLTKIITTNGKPLAQYNYPITLSSCTQTINSLNSKIRIARYFYYIKLLILASIEFLRKPQQHYFVNSCFGLIQLLYIIPLKLFGLKYSILLHGLDIISNAKSDYRLSKWVYSGAHTIYINSKASQNALHANYGKIQVKEVIIYPVIQPEEIDKEQIYSLRQLEHKTGAKLTNKQIVTSICRLDKRKGLDTLITSFMKYHQKHPDSILLIGGRGNMYDSLQTQINHLNAKEYIKLLGFIDNQTKYSILKYARLFVMPTKSLGQEDFEGFGISFIEASYFCTPVIGGNHGGVPEAINDTKTGYIIDFDKPNSETILTQTIEEILTNKELQTTLGQNGYNWVKQNYTSINSDLF
ncbi:Glycosyltransferase involved in cell wall bisynthesis [Saccharicrinis carchari]|uniref:Glycosyltransferase involved in cell wall bisynthesis n=1 Tax=Saccharicrinis carchari TaxID=1168039 RepID=A0A521AKJ6_SACCC|nr:glycosyltransferase family 4 protein [Saccharicrinis carchari]SMO35326.1 Glycosyltransferase involved in cell wall bisynthesis [Saccharicrinis carchari]